MHSQLLGGATTADIPQLLWRLLNGDSAGGPPKVIKSEVANFNDPNSMPGTVILQKEEQNEMKPNPDNNSNVEATIFRPTPRLFALIIGINTYKETEIPNLKGAVADAEAVEDYLEDRLGIPPAQITVLQDIQATRANIIHYIQALGQNDAIKTGDPILIYYAGHGTYAPAPDGWESWGNQIELLVPYDYKPGADSEVSLVHAIPDRTLAALLAQLADKKGNNITVILDSCHSGSGTREERAHRGTIRGINSIEIPSGLDQHIWQYVEVPEGRATMPAGFVHSALDSHVLLAGCGAKELAREQDGGGVFTTTMLHVLKSVGAEKLTYKDLLERMPILPKQNPQCEGNNKRQILFNGKAPSKTMLLYRVRQDMEAFIMEAGNAHGISEGAEFAIYKDYDSYMNDHPLGTLIATRVQSFVSTLGLPENHPKFDLCQDGIALQTRAGHEVDLCIHVEENEKLYFFFKALAEEMQKPNRIRKISLVEESQATFDFTLEQDSVRIKILDPRTRQLGLTQIEYLVDLSNRALILVLEAAAHFNWHLNRANIRGALSNKVDIELVELKSNGFGFPMSVFHPKDDPPVNLIRNNTIDLPIESDSDDFVETKSVYGFNIRNNSKVPLYVSLFYFNASDLSITQYFLPSTAGQAQADPPLLAEGKLTVGYGSAGARPFKFNLEEKQNLDVGFIKLFLSTRPIDLSGIPQETPFGYNRLTSVVERKAQPHWDSVLISMVQRRVRTDDTT